MTTPIAEMHVPVMLDRARTMVFNANTMCAYEQATGKFFLSTVSDLFRTIFPQGLPEDTEEQSQTARKADPLALVRKVSMTELRALLWASLHEYDEKDDPYWPLTISQVGRLLNFQNVIPVFHAFLLGQTGNSPSREDMGESRAEARTTRPGSGLPPNTAENGGEPGIVLPEDAFA